jgi:transposase
VLQYHFNWKVLSAIAGITWWNFYFRLYRKTIRAPQVVDFLAHLLRHLPGRLLVIWDRSNTHRSHLVGEFVAGQQGRLALDYLPAYAPELNPVEYIWGYWKHHELPNFLSLPKTSFGMTECDSYASGRRDVRVAG